MKNSSKNNYSEKNSDKYNKSPDSKIHSKNTNSSKKNNRFSLNSSNNKGVKNLNSVNKNKNNFSILRTRKPP